MVATYSHHLPGWLRVPWPLVALALTLALVAVLPIDLCFFDAQLERTRARCGYATPSSSPTSCCSSINAIVVSVRARAAQRRRVAALLPAALLDIVSSAPYDLIAAAAGAPPPTWRAIGARRLLRALRLADGYARALHGALQTVDVRVPRMSWLLLEARRRRQPPARRATPCPTRRAARAPRSSRSPTSSRAAAAPRREAAKRMRLGGV